MTVVDYPLAALRLQELSAGRWLWDIPPYLIPQVRGYAERMLAGDQFPPVQLTPDGGIIDGHRRCWAAAMCGMTTIKAVVVTASERIPVLLRWLRSFTHHPLAGGSAVGGVLAHHHHVVKATGGFWGMPASLTARLFMAVMLAGLAVWLYRRVRAAPPAGPVPMPRHRSDAAPPQLFPRPASPHNATRSQPGSPGRGCPAAGCSAARSPDG